MAGELPHSWRDALNAKKAELGKSGPLPGIRATSEMVAALADAILELIAGAPDLEAATQHKRQLKPFTAGDRSGRYIHYGAREHAMGAMMNGMTVHGGIVSMGTTFLVFSDYMRHTQRMAALTRIPGLLVFSHDSIGIGKNGPTHQPVEYLASLRAYPNMWTIRPADAVEMAEAWELGLEHRNGPTSIICSRQPLDCLRKDAGPENRSAKGAYVIAEADGSRQATILATGSEVAVALAARGLLKAKGIETAVVSMPCWELFEQQPKAYRSEVLGTAPRVAVEAAVRFGWDRYIGADGVFIRMNGFGASVDYPDLFRHFDITPEAVSEAARRSL